MRIVHVEEFADGSARALVADDNDNIVAEYLYSPESYPRPVVSGEETLWRRIQDWWRS